MSACAKIQGQLLVTILALLADMGRAQTAVTVTTNRFLAPANFREIDGQLYDAYHDYGWVWISDEFRVWARTNRQVVLRAENPERNYRVATFSPRAPIPAKSVKEWSKTHDSPPPHPVPYRDPGSSMMIVLKNGPVQSLQGGYINEMARFVGTSNYFGGQVGIYDCGQPHYVTYFTTNRIQSPKAR